MANEKRLIDAYKLEDLVRSNSARYHHTDDVIAAIAGQTTVDAVEVVRCKDCIWFSKKGYDEENAHEDDLSLHMGHCAMFRAGIQACRFCSYGERREGE